MISLCSLPSRCARAGVILCWVGLFAPGIILIFGILPFWGAFRCGCGGCRCQGFAK